MRTRVDISSQGIKKVLRNYNPSLALAEYIWNGFDANASRIDINYNSTEFGGLDLISIKDNGSGIDMSKLAIKFKPFYETTKVIEITNPKHTSTYHGKNGVGRLTFFTFCNNATWKTTYFENEKLKSGSISINVNGLNTFSDILFDDPISKYSGTEVIFSDIFISVNDLELEILPYLVCEFCWFLELNNKRNFQIFINNIPFGYTENIADYEDNILIQYPYSNVSFNVKYVQWKYSLHKEFSKYYFIDSNNQEAFKDFTTLNKKGDEFYHSVFIKSEFFNNFDTLKPENDNQLKLFSKARSSPEFKFLIQIINEKLRLKRKPFLRESANKLIEKYESEGILPAYESEWENKYRKSELEEVIKGFYEAQPKLFTSLNIEQKKTLVRLIDLLLDTNERSNLFGILEQIVELEPEERKELSELLTRTRLSNLIETIKLIEDRYKTVYLLKELVFNDDLKANEKDHLQKMIESHYWLFGEQYQLVTAAEPKFEEALNRYIYLLTEQDVLSDIDHPHRLKEMDIFACRQNIFSDRIDNIVVELKHPIIKLGSKHYNQIHNYLDTILKQPEFNANNMHWEFFIVAREFDTSGFINNLITTNKPHGLPSLIMSLEDGRIKVYAKKWSEIFGDFEIRHKHINEKMKLERDKLIAENISAESILKEASNNTAIQPNQPKTRQRRR